jgi:DNA-binding transcriptional regulator LsrR (DeoR family)
MITQVDSQEYRLCVRVAKLYYENGLTQNEIAQKMGVSRVTVYRLLNKAVELGIVEIKIHAPFGENFDLEQDLIVRYNLRDAVVVPDPEGDESIYLALARGAADWLKRNLKSGMRVGLGLGRTISHLPLVFSTDEPINCTFTEVVGGASDHSGGFAKYNVTSKMAELAGGKAEFLYAPNMVSSAELQKSLLNEPSISQALERARRSDIVLQSVGTVDETAILYVEKKITLEQLREIQNSEAVGDALGHYFDCNGQMVSTFLDNRIIGIGLEDLKKVPWSVLVAGGEEKKKVIQAAMKGAYFNVLITNADTARFLLSERN